MKGVKKCFGLLLALFIIFGLSLSVSSSVNAANVQSPTIYWRAYTSDGNLVSEAWSSTGNLSKPILQYSTGQYRTLQGFTIDFAVEDTLTTRYKTLVVKARLMQSGVNDQNYPSVQKSFQNPSVSHVNLGSSTSSVVRGSSCTMQWLGNTTVEYTCSVDVSDYYTISNAQVTLGYAPTTIIHSDPIATLCGISVSPECYGTVYLDSVSYDLAGRDDATDTNVEHIYGEVQRTNNLLEQQIQQDQQDRQDLQNQSSDIDSSADSSQQSAENTGQTLLAAFSSFVTAITNARPSNCNIDMDLGNLDLGIVNFCQLSPPAPFQTIASIFMILFFVPLSIATARKVINLFRSFQG